MRIPTKIDTHFVYKQHCYKQRQVEIGKKIKQKLSNTLSIEHLILEISHILHPRYLSKIMGNILKNKERNKFVCIHEIIQSFII